MGFKTADMPPVDPAAYGDMPFMDRMRLQATHWAEYGFGSPKTMNMLYVYKLIFYVLAGVAIVGITTPGLSFGEFGAWWGELIVYQKLMVWTILFEITGYASSSGPLAFKFSPFTGGWRYWTRRGTLRLPPWQRAVPFTKGDHRTTFDVALYFALLATLLFLLVSPGVTTGALPGSDVGLLPQWGLLTYVGLIIAMGLRDRVVFLAARSEQYLAVMFFFGLFSSHVDMVLAAKVALVTVWFGAGVSKFGRHFTNVVPPMLSNTPWLTSKRFKRSLYRDFPDDMRPSKVTWTFAHIGGTVVELVLPLVLLFSTNMAVTWLAIAGMILFHIFITSTFPLAVPLEWNVFYMFAPVWLFAGFPAGDGYGLADVSSPWILLLVFAAFVAFPILGNLRPDLVSFLPSMRQYAGNWASALWAFRGDEVENKLNQHLTKFNDNQVDQLSAAYGKEVAEIFMQKAVAWRTLHSQGRALMSLMMRHLDELENYRIREGEFTCTTLVGWQFGDAHLHNEQTITAVQQRCHFSPGECVVVWIESQPIHRKTQDYKVIDAAVGVVERGYYHVDAAVEEQPWLPNGPIEHTVTWRMPGYEPAGTAYSHPAVAMDAKESA
ncbi:transmembrane protein DUF3556 [Halopolyspora algeriensis]|uniref:Transmembrane protein DUF3556 n=1 Tax=Halopolyspora algeriensis TaxID=1500506 RepID=A0A368VKD8_9ACTN|nr:DUF3556 domain-containing protein [Halopolyspora algeriensis]RCW41019.1 transmembrane protein DUF3556 [Halopolyspora algeriensis]TQM53897.1 transmembrane protein DUF3556 [Halopolyspora algeriensis]